MAAQSLLGNHQTRAFFEPRFKRDFSQVRIHADSHAAESARAVNALAYTAGHDIAFDASQYAPGTQPGDRLLAHELTHVVQQSGNCAADGMLQRDTGKKDEKKNAPDVKTPDPAKTPCLTSPDCAKPIPGSSWDFARKAQKTQADTKKNEEEMRQHEKEEAEKKKQTGREAPRPAATEARTQAPTQG